MLMTVLQFDLTHHLQQTQTKRKADILHFYIYTNFPLIQTAYAHMQFGAHARSGAHGQVHQYSAAEVLFNTSVAEYSAAEDLIFKFTYIYVVIINNLLSVLIYVIESLNFKLFIT